MERSIVSRIDDNFGKKRTEFKYPYLFIEHNTDAISVVLHCLKRGDLPVVFYYNGNLTTTINIDRSPLTLKKILRLYPFKLYFSATDFVEIKSIKQLLEEERLWTPS